MIHWITTTVVARSVSIAGKATLTIDSSMYAMLDARTVAVSTQGFALAAQIESARAAAMAPWAHGLAAALATSSSSCRLHTVVERARGSLVATRLIIA
jgi:hypothetical protein